MPLGEAATIGRAAAQKVPKQFSWDRLVLADDPVLLDASSWPNTASARTLCAAE